MAERLRALSAHALAGLGALVLTGILAAAPSRADELD